MQYRIYIYKYKSRERERETESDIPSDKGNQIQLLSGSSTFLIFHDFP